MWKTKKTLIFIVLPLLLITAIVSGCIKRTPPNPTAVNSVGSDQTASTTHETNNGMILKLIGQDENGWNIYQSEKYGIGFVTPPNWVIDKFGNDDQNKYDYITLDNVDTESKNDSMGIKFYLNVGIPKINNIAQFIEWKCNNSNSCKENYESYSSDIFYNECGIVVKTVEPTGVGGMTSTIYYIINSNILFTFTIDNLDEIKKGWGDGAHAIQSDAERDNELNTIVSSIYR